MLDFLLYEAYLETLPIRIKIVNINVKCECYFWIFKSKSNLTTLLIFHFLENFSKISIKGIRVRYADFFILLSIFKGIVDVN